MIPKNIITNFEFFKQLRDKEQLVVAEFFDKKTNEPRYFICAVEHNPVLPPQSASSFDAVQTISTDPGQHKVAVYPIAEMFDYDMVEYIRTPVEGDYKKDDNDNASES